MWARDTERTNMRGITLPTRRRRSQVESRRGLPELPATWHGPDPRLRAQPSRLSVPDGEDTSSPQGQGEREHRLRARSS